MKTLDFDYNLPSELIAQFPAIPRDSSRLFVYDRKSDIIQHKIFKDIVNILDDSFFMVMNKSKVIPARFWVKKDTGAKIEILFLEKIKDKIFKAYAKPAKRLKRGLTIYTEDKKYAFRVLDKGEEITFENLNEEDIFSILDKIGVMPLPPYIKRKKGDFNYKYDKNKYQTVYAEKKGSVAAPTAGLHFTKELLSHIKKKGINIYYITLHVGAGTFKPVKTENVLEHKMHKEWFEVDKATAFKIAEEKKKGKKLLAVGTTTVRTLETIYDENYNPILLKGYTDLMIIPGYKFKMIDALITNFHLPRSTLLMLVCALVGREKILELYNIAIEKKYRFYSYGDAMLIL